jgi:hypothetical protein
VWRLVLNDVGHISSCQTPVAVLVGTYLVWPELAGPRSSLARCARLLSCAPVHDFLDNIAYGIRMVVQDNACSRVKLILIASSSDRRSKTDLTGSSTLLCWKYSRSFLLATFFLRSLPQGHVGNSGSRKPRSVGNVGKSVPNVALCSDRKSDQGERRDGYSLFRGLVVDPCDVRLLSVSTTNFVNTSS